MDKYAISNSVSFCIGGRWVDETTGENVARYREGCEFECDCWVHMSGKIAREHNRHNPEGNSLEWLLANYPHKRGLNESYLFGIEQHEL
jgi:hypothetical protein